MNDKIKAAAEERYPLTRDLTEQSIANYQRMAFMYGAEYFRKESGVEELRKAAHKIVDCSKKADPFAENLKVPYYIFNDLFLALSKSDLFFNDKNLNK